MSDKVKPGDLTDASFEAGYQDVGVNPPQRGDEPSVRTTQQGATASGADLDGDSAAMGYQPTDFC